MPALNNFVMPTVVDKNDRKLMADIQNYGWHVVHILEEDDQPRYSFSIGFYYQFGQPEILVMGLDFDSARQLINNIGHEFQQGLYLEEDQYYPGYILKYDICFKAIPMEYYHEYTGYACWFYHNIGKSFPIWQCVLPDNRGIFPWEEHYDVTFAKVQHLLIE